MSEVIETSLPQSLRNHWWWRPGWAEGRHFYACHLTLNDQPQLRELVAEYQKALTGVQGIDLIPPQWLHLTMQGIGFTDEIDADELAALDHALTAELATIEPPAAQFRYLTVRPEAIYLKAHPAAVLYPLRQKMHEAVISVLGRDRFTEPAPDYAQFLPHVSIGYINRDGEAEPIAAALSGLAVRTVEATFTKADLLEFHRDHRMYEWTSATPIQIGRSTTSPLAVTLLLVSSRPGRGVLDLTLTGR
jgi:2'-5' RNA ligase